MLQLSKRHVAKTISWRAVGTLDTIVISLIITGKLDTGVKIGVAELLTKLILYYAHERFWFTNKKIESNKRHIFKTFTWRFIGTVDTILLGWLFSGNPLTGLKIGAVEIVSKMILYFVHEKVWYRLSFGLKKKN